MQHADGRVIFVIPYQGLFTLIGTTVEQVKDSLDQIGISEQEIDYLINVTNQYFRQAISRSDIVHTFSGVRPLVEEAGKAMSQVSDGFKLEFEPTSLPFLSAYGGKVTTYRLLAKKALNKLTQYFPKANQPWPKTVLLPGGDFDSREFLAQEITARYAWFGT
jgi:glycerol-3-phosphate dehydrogenase